MLIACRVTGCPSRNDSAPSLTTRSPGLRPARISTSLSVCLPVRTMRSCGVLDPRRRRRTPFVRASRLPTQERESICSRRSESRPDRTGRCAHLPRRADQVSPERCDSRRRPRAQPRPRCPRFVPRQRSLAREVWRRVLTWPISASGTSASKRSARRIFHFDDRFAGRGEVADIGQFARHDSVEGRDDFRVAEHRLHLSRRSFGNACPRLHGVEIRLVS